MRAESVINRPRLGRWQAAEGQAVTELLLLAPLFVLLLAMLFQLYLVGRTVQRSTTTAHALLFDRAFEHNCADQAEDCTYGSGVRGTVVWTPTTIPEVTIPLLHLFARPELESGLRLWSNSPLNGPGGCAAGEDCVGASDGCPGRPCKRSKLTVGSFSPFADVFRDANMLPDPLAWFILAGQ